MRMIHETSNGGWVVEISKEEMQKLNPTYEQNWMVHFREGIAGLRLNIRVHNCLNAGIRRSTTDQSFILCFKKDGLILSFDEWCKQPDLEIRLQMLRGIGITGARHVVKAIKERNEIVYL